MKASKLAVIVENLKALKPIKDMTQEEYVRDLYKRKAAERLLQELIEAAIDINKHIIVGTGNTVPDDYYESFIRAGELKIISELVLEFTLFCHPEPCPELVSWVVSGSKMALFCEMLNQVQHDTGKRDLFLKNQINIKNSNKISGAFENTRPIWTTVQRNRGIRFGEDLGIASTTP